MRYFIVFILFVFLAVGEDFNSEELERGDRGYSKEGRERKRDKDHSDEGERKGGKERKKSLSEEALIKRLERLKERISANPQKSEKYISRLRDRMEKLEKMIENMTREKEVLEKFFEELENSK